MPEKFLDLWSKANGIILGIIGIGSIVWGGFMALLSNKFLTKKEHARICGKHSTDTQDQFRDILRELKEGNRRFKKTERYLVLLGTKVGITKEEIDNMPDIGE